MARRAGAWKTVINGLSLQLDGAVHHVTAGQIRELTTEVDARLLARCEKPSDLPPELRQNGYSILPVRNGAYVLFKGDIFASVPPRGSPQPFEPKLDLSLLTAGRGVGETQYIDYAHNIGLLSAFAKVEPLYLMIRGRERTTRFSLQVAGHPFDVQGVQFEVDAGYEGERDILLVEAKMDPVLHINVRQLYYPLRHFSILFPQKRVRPMLFHYDAVERTYCFHEYRFTDANNFDSLEHMRVQTYTLQPRAKRALDSLIDVRCETTSDIVPQADDLDRVIELLLAVDSGMRTPDQIAQHFGIDRRQSQYYAEAAEYLSLMSRSRGEFGLTEGGRRVLPSLRAGERDAIARCVVNSWILRALITHARQHSYFDNSVIEHTIAQAASSTGQPRYSSSTVPRRRQTVVAWISWLVEHFGCLSRQGDRYLLS